MEERRSIRADGDGRGHTGCWRVIRDQPSTGNTVDFTLATDPTLTRSTVTEPAETVRAFLTVGGP